MSTLVSLIFKDGVTLNLFASGVGVLVVGILLMLLTRKHSKEMNKREGYIVVTLGWVAMAISGAIPYMVTNVIPVLFLKRCLVILLLEQQY